MALMDLNERLQKYSDELFFGKWKLDGATPDEALLGKGKFGRVYAVYCEEMDRTGHLARYSSAIKLIAIDEQNLSLSPNASREKRQARLKEELDISLREIEIMKKLEGESNIAYFQNSQIVPRTDTELQSWDVLICMEKLIPLHKHLRDENLYPGSYPFLMKVLYLWKEIAMALRVCEKNTILHMDVKPENVFYAPGPDHFKLSDFGISISATTFPSGKRYGTYAYMAPEMYHRQGGDSRMDIYSLAVMIYELFNGGRLPFQQGVGMEERKRACDVRLEERKQIPPLKGVPADVNETLLRCLDVDPRRRFAHCGDLADASTELYLKYKKMRALPTRRRNWVKPTLFGAIALIALGTGAILLSGGDSDAPGATPADAPEAAEAADETIATAAPVKLALIFDAPEGNVYEPGRPVPLSGRLSVLQGEVDFGALSLWADGRAWPMEIAPAEGDNHTFRVELSFEREGNFELPVDVRSGDDPQALASGVLGFVCKVSEPVEAPADEADARTEAKPTPTPVSDAPASTPTPEPAPVLDLNVELPVLWSEEGVRIRGTITTDRPVDASRLSLVAENVRWPLEVSEFDESGRCNFSAQGALPEEVESLLLAVELERPGASPVRSAPVGVPIEHPEPTPTPVPALSLTLEETQVTAGTGKLALHGRVKVEGELNADALAISINGSRAHAEWTSDAEGFAFVATLEMDLMGADEVQLRVSAPGSAGVQAVQQILPVVTPAPTDSPEPQPIELIPIEIFEAEAMDGAWLGVFGARTLQGRAQPDEALELLINGESVGSYAADAAGNFAVDVLSGSLSEGENEITLRYARPGVTSAPASLRMGLDTAAPEIDIPEKIDQGASELRVGIRDRDAACVAALLVDGKEAQRVQAQEGAAVFTGLDALSLNDASAIAVHVWDNVDNRSERSIRFERLLRPIDAQLGNEQGPAEWVGPASGAYIRGSAEPGTLLSIELGGQRADVQVDAAGAFAWAIAPEALAQGSGTASIRYESYGGAPLTNATGVELEVRCDAAPPEARLQPGELTLGERALSVACANEPGAWRAALRVNEQEVARAETSGAGELVLNIPETVALERGAKIELVLSDAVGNVRALSVPYVVVAPIQLQCAPGVWGQNTDSTLMISGESGAKLMLWVNDAPVNLVIDGAPVDLKALLSPGANQIRAAYSAENGYPERALAGTEAALSLEYAPASPEVSISTAVINRDTSELIVRTTNEPYGYRMELRADGQTVWSSGDVQGEEVRIEGIQDMALNDKQQIELYVEDGRNAPTVLQLRYENSGRAEAFVLGGGAALGEVNAGGEIALNAIALCNQVDMKDGYVTMHLVGSDGGSASCRFEREDMDASEIDRLSAEQNLQLSDYVDSAYRITRARIPQNCASGDYTLELQIETVNETYNFPVGALVVRAQEQTNRVSAPALFADAGYAIGLDAPLQGAFRAENVVLTGWVCRAPGKLAYFDHCEVFDAYGRAIGSIQFSPEVLSQYVRGALDTVGLDGIELETEDAGFVIRLNLSEMNVSSGEMYELRFHTSNETGESWPSVTAHVYIDAGAAEISEEALNQLVARWIPAAPTPAASAAP